MYIKRETAISKFVLTIIIIAFLSQYICKYAFMICPENILESDIIHSDSFRNMNVDIGSIQKLNDFAKKNKITPSQAVALYFCENYSQLSSKSSNDDVKSIYSFSKIDIKLCRFAYEKKQKQAFCQIKNACDSVFGDLKYFPVAQNLSDSEKLYTVSYIDTWFGERSYGGNRRHEGTDIMADENIRGVYPVISSTSGIVEKIGWLKLGGYRIGIRAENGGYFYYAHLSSYSKDYKAGDYINAGEIIGFMGDSGYGPVGTVGKFDVHLHFGIYFRDFDGNEVSVNPYYILKCLENDKKKVCFY